jgi:hypothetical protein
MEGKFSRGFKAAGIDSTARGSAPKGSAPRGPAAEAAELENEDARLELFESYKITPL